MARAAHLLDRSCDAIASIFPAVHSPPWRTAHLRPLPGQLRVLFFYLLVSFCLLGELHPDLGHIEE
jgi:hypothetical protein